MRKLLFLFVLFAAPAFAQNPTIVTGTITDPNGVAWYPGTVTATLTPATAINPTVNGQRINPNSDSLMRVTVPTNPDGSFSMSLFPNAAISPGGTQWVFFVSTNGSGQPAGLGAKNFTVTITIAGASQDVGATLRASAPILLASGSGGTVVGITGGNPVTFTNPVVGFQDKGSQVYNVLAYGAKCDGATDDSTAINNTLAAMVTAGGGKLLFPAGTCMAHGLLISNTVPETIEGAGQGVTIIKQPNTMNDDVFRTNTFATLHNSGSNAGSYNISMRNLTIDGNKGNNLTAGVGINFFGWHSSFEHITIQNTRGDGFYTEWGLGAGVATDTDMALYFAFNNILGAGGNGITNNGPHDNNIFYNDIHDNAGWCYQDGKSGFYTGAGAHMVVFNGYSCTLGQIDTETGIIASGVSVAGGATNSIDFKIGAAASAVILTDSLIGESNQSSAPIGLDVGNQDDVFSGLRFKGNLTAMKLRAGATNGSYTGLEFDSTNTNFIDITSEVSTAKNTIYATMDTGAGQPFTISGVGGTVPTASDHVHINNTAGTSILQIPGAYITNAAAGSNVFVGGSGNSTVSGNSNTCFGHNNCAGLAAGSWNTVIGQGSGNLITSGGGNMAFGNSAGTVIATGSNNGMFGSGANVGAAQTAAFQFGNGTNNNDNTIQYQSWSFFDWSGNVRNNLLYTKVGTVLASAATIAPLSGITHVSGTTAIVNITVPTVAVNGGSYTGCIKLIPDAVWTTTAAGNIALATTAVLNKPLEECYDGTKWYPSY